MFELPKGRIFTICNLAIFVIVLLLLLHVLGYVEMRVKNKEGMSNTGKTFNTVIVWFGIALSALFILGSIFSGSANK
jgi:hypothetical protein